MKSSFGKIPDIDFLLNLKKQTMKKVIYSLLLVFAAVFIACEEELPKANFDLYELKSLEATAGDMSVMLAWEDYENARPSEYLVVWDAGNAGSDGGQMTVEAGKKSVVVENLENDMTYSFSVQPRYANGLAGKTSVKSTPKNARYPVTDLSATAGSERVRLSWTKPNSERFTNYQITVNPGGKVITLDDTSLEFYVVDGLVNDTEYTFSMIASYPTGNSEVVEASATPGKLSPILIDQSDKTELILWESATFTLNDMFFMGGDVQSVSWDFGDGTISTELSPQHAYGTVKDKYTVSVTVTYTNGTADTGSMDVAVVNYKWNSIKLQSGNYTGYVKVSNPVFSPDGKTMYIPTSTPAGHLFAIDVATGDFKWVYGIDAPVLARSDIGIAMGGVGSDVAIEAADVVLMSDDITSIAKAIQVSHYTNFILKENVTFTLLIKIGVLVLTLFGLTNMWMGVFADVGVTLIAICNSMRILYKKS